LLSAFKNNDATLLLGEVHDPRMYGNALLKGERIVAVEEKPRAARSKWAIMPFYLFHPSIFTHLETLVPGKNDEIQLTDGIQSLISKNMKVNGVKLIANELRLDIGTPETYWNALEVSYNFATHR
jgi:glucose-1-phosphate thymidylyltransferase